MPRLPPRTPFETGLEVLSLLGLLMGVALLLVSWPTLPDRVPGHYALAGNVTRYGSKGTLWSIVGINAGLYTLMTLISLFPQAWNLPGSPADRPRQFRLAQAFIHLLKVFVMWFFTYMPWNAVQVAQGSASGLPWWFLPLGLVAPLVMIVGWFYVANRDGAA